VADAVAFHLEEELTHPLDLQPLLNAPSSPSVTTPNHVRKAVSTTAACDGPVTGGLDPGRS